MNRFFKRALSAALLTASALAAQSAAAWQLHWYGQSATKITTPGGKVIVVDPFITKNPVTPADQKDLTALGKVDLLLLTHAHMDHVGDTPAIAAASGAKVALNADFGQTLAALGVLDMKQMIRFNKGGPIEPLPGIKLTMVHAEHSSEFVYTDPDSGKKSVWPGGEPAGFILELEDGYKIYLAGDTGLFGDMKMISDYYQPDLALLPIGGHFTMGPEDAAHALKTMLSVANVLPIHYGTFPLLKGTPEQLQAALGEHKTNLIVMKPGESRDF
jgi:L-ascorbate metabolism protein UlaG (beta-lactamase superfamily)